MTDSYLATAPAWEPQQTPQQPANAPYAATAEEWTPQDQQPSDPQQPAPHRGILDQLTGATGPRYQLFPERMARDIVQRAENTFTAPGTAYQQGLTPDQEIQAAGDTMLTAAAVPGISPISPGARLGSTFGAPPVYQAPSDAARSSVVSAELGAPLPKGVASENRGVQAVTQAARQMPFVGQSIDKATSATVDAAGNAVNNIASDLGATDRASLGSDLRPALSDAIASNKGEIDNAYSTMRGMINPDQTFPPTTTAQVLNNIVAKRAAARQPNPAAGLEQIQNMVDQGISANGLIRAKSDLSGTVDFMNAHGGFSAGDKKQLLGAMSRDLQNIVGQSAPAGQSDKAIAALKDAEGTASQLIGQNRSMQTLLGNGRDEGIVSKLINSADAKSGDLRTLALAKQNLPDESLQAVAGTALQELGQRQGQFSLNQFASKWDNMNPRAKSILFPGQHGKFLDDIAALGRHVKNAEQYANRSNTGRATMLGGAIAAAVHYVPLAMSGDPMAISAVIGAPMVGVVLAKTLARPAVAASVARAARAELGFRQAPTVARRSLMGLTTKSAVDNIAAANGMSVNSFMRLLQSPGNADGQPQQPEPQGVLGR